MSKNGKEDLSDVILAPHLLMRKLALSGVSSESLLTNLLQLFPNLNHLKIETTKPFRFAGDQWEQLIAVSLPSIESHLIEDEFRFSSDCTIIKRNSINILTRSGVHFGSNVNGFFVVIGDSGRNLLLHHLYSLPNAFSSLSLS